MQCSRVLSLLVVVSTALLLSSQHADGVGLIGDTCNATSDCTVANSYCLKNTVCKLGVCTCIAGYVRDFSNAACYQTNLPLGDSCQNTVQCGTSTTCVSFQCKCTSANYRPLPDGINCALGSQMLGENCNITSQCGLRARCTNNTCVCSNAEFKPSDDLYSCRLLTYGEACTMNACDVNVGLSCLSGMCQCNSGQLWKNVTIGVQPPGFRCVSLAAIFDRTYGQDCYDLTTSCGTSGDLRSCSAGLICQECPEDARTCVRNCLINSDMTYCLSSPCQNGGVCNNYPGGFTCTCLGRWTGTFCDSPLPTGLIGDACTVDGQLPCTVANSYCLMNSVCQQGVCACKTGYVKFNASNTACVQSPMPLGGACLSYVQCGTNAGCTSGVCQCSSGFRPDPSNFHCLQGVQMVGGNCTSSSQCGPRARCDATNATCVCINPVYKTTPDKYGCRYLTYGESCSANYCDTTVGLTCVGGMCQCSSGQVWTNITIGLDAPTFQCTPLASLFTRTYGQDCRERSTLCGTSALLRACTPGLVCKECPEDAGTCMSKCLINSDTTACNSSPCQNGGTCNKQTGAYTCTCPFGWTGVNCEQAVPNTCVTSPPSVTTTPVSPTTTPTPVTGSGRIGDQCTLDGLHPCVASNSYCQKNAVCQLGVCACKTGYVKFNASNTDCVAAPVKLGDPCLATVQCGSGAVCSSGVCQCSSATYRPLADGIKCAQGIQILGGNCTTTSQCGALAWCQNNACTCTSAEYFPQEDDSYSCRRRTFGETCITNVCDTTTGMTCTGGKCQCPTGQLWSYVTLGSNPAAYMCVYPQAIFTRSYGQDCHDLTSICANSGSQRVCTPGLVCKECPEDAGTCIRNCLIDSDVTYCLSSPCQNGGVCNNQPGGFTCTCLGRWTGTFCDTPLPTGLIGDTCTIGGPIPCSVANSYCLKNSVCQQGICQCLTGFVKFNSSNNLCLPSSLRLGTACQGSVQCGSNAECINGACRCFSNFRPDSTNNVSCLQGIQPLGANCTTSMQCGSRTKCDAATLTCVCTSSSYTPANDMYSCRFATFGENCTLNSCDFSLGLTCSSGTCQCANSQLWKNITLGLNAPGFQCVSPAAIFTRTYGEDCHDSLSVCSSSVSLKACTAGLVCRECPEDAGTCVRKCLTGNDLTFCLSLPCQNGGTCTNQQAGYTCTCPAGWTGANCELAASTTTPVACPYTSTVAGGGETTSSVSTVSGSTSSALNLSISLVVMVITVATSVLSLATV